MIGDALAEPVAHTVFVQFPPRIPERGEGIIGQGWRCVNDGCFGGGDSDVLSLQKELDKWSRVCENGGVETCPQE